MHAHSDTVAVFYSTFARSLVLQHLVTRIASTADVSSTHPVRKTTEVTSSQKAILFVVNTNL
jgi:hypothetical protein